MAEVRIIERPTPSGAKEYGIRYADGHEKWGLNLPEARAAFTRATRTGKRK